ncbi:MAG: hypothetical protein GWP05_08505 [Anaerolineaceae bacterium]|nr:hypothetical protein [Anaerolineaceae bacterium]
MHTRRARLFSLIAAASLMVIGCQSGAPPEAASRSYCDTDQRFALNVLEKWEAVEVKKKSKDARSDAATFVRGLPEGAGQAVISVTVDSASGIGDLKDYLRSNRELFSNKTVGYDELQATIVTHPGGRRACLIEATFERRKKPEGEVSDGGRVRLRRFRQFAMLHRGKQYIITATGPADATEHWLGEATMMLDSFVIW